MVIFFKCRFCKEEIATEAVVEKIQCPTCNRQYIGSKALTNYMKKCLK